MVHIITNSIQSIKLKKYIYKYERHGKKVKPIENIDPETGELISKIVKQIEETWF